MMEKFGALIIVVLVLLVALFFLATQLTDHETTRLRAQAMAIEAEGRAKAAVIQAQGQGRLDTSLAITPILTVMVLALFGFGGLLLMATLGIVFVSYLFKLRDSRQPQQVVYILPRGAPYPALTDRPQYFLVEGGNYVQREQR